MLKHSIAIELKNADISKIFNLGRILVACIKFHGFTNVLMDPEDDNEITQVLCEVHKFHPNNRYYHAVGHLRTKGAKSKQVRLWLMLNKLKNSQHILIDVIRRRS